MPNKLSDTFSTHTDKLNTAIERLQSTLNQTQLISRANLNNLLERLNKLQFKITDIVDDMEELQYDLDKEDVKSRPDPLTDRRIEDFEKTYDILQPVLGLAMLAYVNNQ